MKILRNRNELEKYVGKTAVVYGEVTDTFHYKGRKRLVKHIKVMNFDIDHIWFNADKLSGLRSGNQHLEVEIIQYTDAITHEVKFGMEYIGKRIKKKKITKMPKWKQEEAENRSLIGTREDKGLLEYERSVEIQIKEQEIQDIKLKEKKKKEKKLAKTFGNLEKAERALKGAMDKIKFVPSGSSAAVNARLITVINRETDKVAQTKRMEETKRRNSILKSLAIQKSKAMAFCNVARRLEKQWRIDYSLVPTS